MKKVLASLAVVGVLAAATFVPVGAQNATIADMAHGYFRTAGENETTIVSLNDDPPKHRMGVLRDVLGTLGGRSLGALSWNIVDRDGREDEHVLQQGKRSETGGGEFYLGLKKPNGGSGDADMDDVLVVTHEGGFSFRLPVYAPNLTGGGGGGSTGTTLVHPAGRTWLAAQGDGNFVLYVNLEKFNYSTGFPVWASHTVMLDEHGQPTPKFQELLKAAGKTFIP